MCESPAFCVSRFAMRNLSTYLLALLVFGGLLLTGHSSRAQIGMPPEPAVVVSDTAETRQVVVTPEAKRRKETADSTKRTEHMFRAFGYKGIRLTRPGKAALLAALLPGAGQVYNRRYWKLPLVYGALGGVIYGEYFYQKGYREFADAYNNITERNNNPQTGVAYQIGDAELGPRARLVRDVNGLSTRIVFFRGNRDIFYLYIGLAYSLQIVDALVDAHLRDFDVSDDLTLHWEPTLLAVPGRAAALPTAPGVSFALRLK